MSKMLEGIRYRDDIHQYTNREGKVYTSATTLLGMYKTYDKAFWLFYKGVQKALGISEENKKDFSRMCSARGMRWEKTSYEPLYQIIKEFNLDINVIRNKSNITSVEWSEKSKIACDKGTLFHDRKEKEAYESGKDYIGDKVAETQYQYSFDLSKLTDGFHPEVLLYNHKYEIAGRGDKTLIESDMFHRYVDMDDYKTSKTIDMHSFKGKKMKFPLNNVEDCNFNHYQLQLSLYSYMLEVNGFTVRNLKLTHQLVDSAGMPLKGKPEKIYNVKYMRPEIIKMLEHHAQTRLNKAA